MNILMTPVRQHVADEQVGDIGAEVRRGLRSLPLSEHVRPGMRVALAVGSRGISCLQVVVHSIIEEIAQLDGQPFFVPAMGSHGGGTAEMQRTIVEETGLQPEFMDVPVYSSMETVQIGATPDGMPVFLDAHAARADAIIAINRIKPHTSFRATWESGLMKILAIGLGKARGAEEIHRHGVVQAMPAAARVILAKAPVIAGVGIVENGRHQPAKIAVLPAERIEAEEPVLLEMARQLIPKVPLEPLDLLLIQEMGKEISGLGMDTNVIGMWRRLGGPIDPLFKVVAVLSLTARSHGNASGVGLVDLIPQRLRDAIDLDATYTNCLTSGNFPAARIPLTLPTDRDVVRAALASVDDEEARMVIIRNTLNLDLLWVSQPLLKEVKALPTLQIAGEARPLTFDDEGVLRLWDANARAR